MKKTTGIIVTVLVVAGIAALLASNKKKMNAEASSTIEAENGVSVNTVKVEAET